MTTELTREILIDATPATVFSYLVVPEKLLAWQGTEATLDPRPGGSYRVLMGGSHPCAGEYPCQGSTPTTACTGLCHGGSRVARRRGLV
jgi:uncharacterized protein YndB with AHSA1/START domain